MKLLIPNIVLLLSLLWMVVVPGDHTAQASAPAQVTAAAGLAWYDGAIQYSTITNCVSIIQGAPYPENGAGAYVGFLADPDNALPAPNTVYYIHIVVAGLGNSCSGMRAYLDVGLPANTSLAIDGTNPVYCLFDNVQIAPASDCPQVLPASSYNPGMYEIPSTDSAHAFLWPIPQGHFLEIQIPVRSTTTLTNSAMTGRVWMIDGNSSPWLQPQQGVYVFSSQPTVLYPSPSTTSIMSTTAHSEAYLYTHGLGGTGYFDLGTDTSYSLIHEAVAISAGGNAFLAWDDWGPPALTPDTLYHWRFTFTSTSGTTFGTDQTFRTLPNGIVVVGSGVTGSCTEAALLSALSAGLPITFSCGPLPATINLSSPISITSNTTIDGGNLVTLTTSGTNNHFDVQAGGHLTLTQIALNNGSSTACGGSIHVLPNAQLTLTKTSFNNNTSIQSGGAVCIDSTGSADIHFTTFTSNHSSGGGGVFNWGTLTMDHSSFTTNTSTIHGGALQNYGTGTVSDTSFSQNTAPTNGGAIDAGGVLTIIQDVFTSNISGIRGGGINVYGGTLTVTGSSFITNHSNGYGGGIANDASTVTIQTSEFSGNTAVSVGGGLRSNGGTSVTNSTFTGNQAGTTGGGIDNSDTSSPPDTLTLLNTTLVGNTAGTGGGNLYLGSVSSANVTLTNTLIASGTPNNCDKAVTSQGHNLESANTCGLAAAGDLVNTDPILGPLGDYGGSTQTLPLLPGSPAINTGNATYCTSGSDQRGVSYVSTCDMGAFEARPFVLTITGGNPQSTTVNTAFAQALSLSVGGTNGDPVNGGSITFAAPAGGASATLSSPSVTITGGAASVNATANGTAGSYDVTASAAGVVAPVTFHLTNDPKVNSPTPTTTRTRTSTRTSTRTATSTKTPTGTFTRTSTRTFTRTATPAQTRTGTRPTSTRTGTSTRTATRTYTPTQIRTGTPTVVYYHVYLPLILKEVIRP